MNLNEFNANHLNILLQRSSTEKENVFLLGDFNADLLIKVLTNAFTFFLYDFIIYPTSN